VGTPVHVLIATRTSAGRRSRLFPGTRLAYADLHNHTLLSDGQGDPRDAFASMRDAGLDAAALTDHATEGAAAGIDDAAWRRTGELADAADEPGVFAALRGFEWTSHAVGHVNVWFSDGWTAPAGDHNVTGLYRWLRQQGPALAGFNHPGREPGRFGSFAPFPQVTRRMVAFEVFNRADEYLFKDGVSPLAECLDAGWRVGLVGVSDEHGTAWGFNPVVGRTGLWVRELSRAGLREALLARRVFATAVHDLRLAVRAAGPLGAARMGGALAHRRGPVRFTVGIDAGLGRLGDLLYVHVLRPGPRVHHVQPLRSGELTSFTVDLDVGEGRWCVLRVADRDDLATKALAYASPFWLDPEEAGYRARRTATSSWS
jgi:hypothetical protein